MIMTTTTIALSNLLAPKGNPRRSFDRSAIAGLAQSIRTDGVLQNLVVRPDEDGKYQVVFGKRRFMALQLLRKDSVIGDDYQVPVDIRDRLTDADVLRLAMVENVQREPMAVLDEAEAFAKLLSDGGSIEAIGGQTGLSPQTIKRRLALANLCPQAKKALRTGVISRAVAEALTLGSAAQQRAALDAIEEEGPPDPEYIREMFLEQKPSLAMAIFPRERYEGTVTTDLFADEEASYFDDVDQFLALQREAVDRLAEEEGKSASWVDVLTAYSVPWWQYREAERGEASGAVIHLHPSGVVEVRKGLVRQPVKETVVQETKEAIQVSPTKQRPAFITSLLRYVAHQKSAVVQAVLLRNPRKAKEVAALLLLGAGPAHVVELAIHSCHGEPGGATDDGLAKNEIDRLAQDLADRFGLHSDGEAAQKPGVGRLLANISDEHLWAVTQLSDDELDRLVVLLLVLCFGQDRVDTLDQGDSLFNRVASALDINMREWWTPDIVFLGALRRDQLIALAGESGAAERLGGYKNWSKTELVQGLARYFAAGAAEEGDDTAKGRQWLPGIMRFPAVETL
jgi:ParB family chromosome partitioning protein